MDPLTGLLLMGLVTGGMGLMGAKAQSKAASQQAKAIKEAAKPTAQQQALRNRLQAYYEAMLYGGGTPTPLLDQARANQQNQLGNNSSMVNPYLMQQLQGYNIVR